MERFEGLAFEEFQEDDVDVFTAIMKRAFDEDAKRHLNESEGGPPGYDNGDFLRKYALNQRSEAYKVFMDQTPVGLFIVWIHANGENFLGNMFIDPAVQDKGLGTKVWRFIEKRYPNTKIWRTETPGFSKRNHNFYVNKCGFKITKIVNPGDKYEESYLMEKVMK